MAIANACNSTQLMGCTFIANLAKYSGAFTLAPQAMTALTGFSFAACMAINTAIELYAALQCKDRIAQLTTQLEQKDIPAKDKEILQQAIYIEHAKYENHIRAAKSWMGCAVAMFAVATVAYIAVSVSSCGILPIMTIVVAAIAILSGVIRSAWVKHKDHVNDVKQSLKKDSKGQSLLTRLENVIKNPPEKYRYLFEKDFMVSSYGFYKKSYISYLKELVAKDCKKLENILDKIQGKSIKNPISLPLSPQSCQKVSNISYNPKPNFILADGIGQ